MECTRRLTAVLVLAICFTLAARGQAPAASEQSLAAGRTALQQHHYGKAIRVLEEGLKSFPNDSNLRLELGRAYLYDHKDGRAIELFKQILSEAPSNAEAKLELARAFAYGRDYADSDRLYRELLEVNRSEDSEVGLIRNMIHEGKSAEAREELGRATERHPGSRRLLECEMQLDHHGTPLIEIERVDDRAESTPEGRGSVERLGAGVTYYTDSSGNRSVQSSQQFEYGYIGKFFSRTLVEENSLQQNSGPKANISRTTEEVRLMPLRNVTLAAAGGAVRFDNGSSIGLFQGELGLRLARTFGISGGYARNPVVPTYLAAKFNLISQGWHAGLNLSPRNWSFAASGSSQHYSDGNDSRSADAELNHFFGTPRIALITGYRFGYLSYDQAFAHGYFDPSKYQSHLGGAGISFAGGRHFRGDYSVHVGAESVSGGPFTPAYDITFRNRVLVQQWDFSGIYSYSHLAQSSGAFTSQTSSFMVSYRF
jgi:hypothetical protein